MPDEKGLPPCDGLEKMMYESQCRQCNLRGMYSHRESGIILCCDYYEDIFLKRYRMQETQRLEPRQNISARSRRKSFEDLP